MFKGRRRKLLGIVLTIVMVIGIYSSVYAARDKGYYDFQGTMGNKTKILMSLYIDKETVTGTYIYDKIRSEIKLAGTIKQDRVELREYGKSGKPSAVFQGTIDENNKIEGIWKSQINNKSLPFKLNNVSAMPGTTLGHRYELSGVDKDILVDKFVLELREYIKQGSAKKIAGVVSYPINVTISGKTTKIKNKSDFIREYNKIMNKDFKSSLEGAYTKNLFGNYQGVMFGTNLKNVWIRNTSTNKNIRLEIVGINN